MNTYIGENIAATIKDERMRDCFLANRKLMKTNYQETVEAALLDSQIRMCAETYEYLYREPTPVRYVKGSRPELEQYAQEATAHCENDFERVIALMDRLKMLYTRCNGRILFYGGTEEDLLHKGEQLCECLARLMCALCEVLGISARIITHCFGGHVTNEVYTDGKWWYLDPRAGVYLIGRDGQPASLWELWQDKEIVDLQPEEVKQHVSPRFTWEMRAEQLKNTMLSEYEVNTVKYYSLADASKYSYRWILEDELLDLNQASVEYSVARGAIDSRFLVRPEPVIEFSYHEEQVLSGEVMICVTCVNFEIMPREMIFQIDGKEVYRSPQLVPLAELHHPSSAVYTLGGTGHKFDTGTLSDGFHSLTVSCRFSSNATVTNRRPFWVRNH